jgi:hypothetical protein
VDESCVVWGTKCGQQTNCLVYDNEKMRIYLASFPLLCTVISLMCDMGVWYYAKDLEIYDSDSAMNGDENSTELKSLNSSMTTTTTTAIESEKM